jgi:hypothetical protein
MVRWGYIYICIPLERMYAEMFWDSHFVEPLRLLHFLLHNLPHRPRQGNAQK